MIYCFSRDEVHLITFLINLLPGFFKSRIPNLIVMGTSKNRLTSPDLCYRSILATIHTHFPFYLRPSELRRASRWPIFLMRAQVSRLWPTRQGGSCCRPGSSFRSWFGPWQCQSFEPACRPWRFPGKRRHARHGPGPWSGGHSPGSCVSIRACPVCRADAPG